MTGNEILLLTRNFKKKKLCAIEIICIQMKPILFYILWTSSPTNHFFW